MVNVFFPWSICCFLSETNLTSLKPQGKFSLGNTELNMWFFFFGNLLLFLVHCKLLEISCMHVLCIINETVNVIKKLITKGQQISLHQTFTIVDPVS